MSGRCETGEVVKAAIPCYARGEHREGLMKTIAYLVECLRLDADLLP